MEELNREYKVTKYLPEYEIRDIISDYIKSNIKNITSIMPMGMTFKKQKIDFIICADKEIAVNVILTYGDTICSED